MSKNRPMQTMHNMTPTHLAGPMQPMQLCNMRSAYLACQQARGPPQSRRTCTHGRTAGLQTAACQPADPQPAAHLQSCSHTPLRHMMLCAPATLFHFRSSSVTFDVNNRFIATTLHFRSSLCELRLIADNRINIWFHFEGLTWSLTLEAAADPSHGSI